MENPLRSESAAFRFLLLVLANAGLPHRAAIRSFARTWANTTIRHRRAIVLTLTTDIVIHPRSHPGASYDPTRIHITWRA